MSSFLLESGKRPRVGSTYVELDALSASARKPGTGNRSNEHIMPTFGMALVKYDGLIRSFHISTY